MKKALLLVIMAYTSFMAFGQNTCGTVSDMDFLDKVDVYKNMISSGLVESRNETIYIPIKFHLVASSSGLGRLRIDKMLDQLHGLNVGYDSVGFQFYFDNDENGLYNEINSDAVNNDQGTQSAQFLMNAMRDVNAMNIFIVQALNRGNAIGVYFGGSLDWIVDLKSETNVFSTTLTHEAGHFFGLPHTQEGFDAAEWVWGDEGDESNVPAPVISPQGNQTELVDRSNCEIGGDRICDTPADYGVVQNGCSPWTRTDIWDPDSVPITPLITNVMSWSSHECDPQFTQGQIDVMNGNYASSGRNYLRPIIAPQVEAVTNVQILTFPEDDEIVLNGSVTLTWEEDPNAEFYLVNLSDRASFTTGFREMVVSTNELTIDDLNDDDDYYWNVRPFSTYYTDPNVKSESWHFETGLVSAVNDIEGLNTFNLTPNPVNKNEFLSLRLNSQNSLTKARIEIRDITGRILLEQNIGHISSGPQVFNIETPELSSGYYLLSLNSEQGVKSERFLAL